MLGIEIKYIHEISFAEEIQIFLSWGSEKLGVYRDSRVSIVYPPPPSHPSTPPIHTIHPHAVWIERPEGGGLGGCDIRKQFKQLIF